MKAIELKKLITNFDKKKTVIVTLILGIIIFCELYLILPHQIKGIVLTTKEITKLKKGIANLKKEYNRMKSLMQEEPTAKDKVSSSSKKIYASSELPVLLKNISQIANNNNVRVVQISFNEEKNGMTKGKTPTKKATKNKKDSLLIEKYLAFNIEMEIEAGYHNIGRFLTDLDNSDAVLETTELSISIKPQDILKQEAKLTLRTYVKP